MADVQNHGREFFRVSKKKLDASETESTDEEKNGSVLLSEGIR
jgi:hypothetical protein